MTYRVVYDTAFQVMPVVLGGLLGWTGSQKLLDRPLRQQAADSALVRLLPNAGQVAQALRLLGAVELVLAAALLGRPTSAAPASGVAVLGVGFLGYLWWARATAPDSPCGCTSGGHTRITWRSFTRAGLVAAGGLAATRSPTPWWQAISDRPVVAVLVLVAVLAMFGALSSDLDEVRLLPLRRARLRLFGHPLAVPPPGGPVPVSATVELLENSLAWEATAPVVRSALQEHWDADGWRFLRFSGVSDGPVGSRAVSVVFVLDASASTETADQPTVRVAVIDEQHQQPIEHPLALAASSSPTSVGSVPLARAPS